MAGPLKDSARNGLFTSLKKIAVNFDLEGMDEANVLSNLCLVVKRQIIGKRRNDLLIVAIHVIVISTNNYILYT